MSQSQQTIKKDDRSLGDLFSELASETSTLIRQEVALAQVEITQKAARVGTQIGYLAVGGGIALLATLSLLTALIIGLGQLIHRAAGVTEMTGAWISALIVGLVIGAVAYLLVSSALKKLRQTNLTPRQSIESLKEDAQWLKNQVS
jgi:hypothetical protein